VFDGIGLRTGVAGQLDGFGRAPNDGKEQRERDREPSGEISGRREIGEIALGADDDQKDDEWNGIYTLRISMLPESYFP
jgi:hypothetical protein